MANFLASQLVAAQTKFKARFQEPELRRKQNPALVLALQNLDVCMPEATTLRTREDRPVNAYLFKRRQPTNGNARAARPNGTKGDSIATGLSWQTISETFTISMKQADANVFSFQEMLANEMLQVQQNLHDRLGTILLNYLIAHRSNAPLTAPQGATWDADDQAYQVAAADSTYFFQKLGSIMNQHYWRGQLDVVADPSAFDLARKLRAQGAQNATNLSFQFDQLNIIQTTEAINSNFAGSALAMQSGSFALFPWIPKQNREGYGDYQSYNGGYGVLDDMLGTEITSLDESGNLVKVPLQYALFGYTQAADDQANNGYYQDQVTTFEVSLDIAPLLPQLSNANETPVIEFLQAAA